jgi:hypothetical protein
MNRETLVNTVMVSIVILMVIGSVGLVEKHMHDKDVAEKKAAEETKKMETKVFQRLTPLTPKEANVQEGFILYKGKMIKTKGEILIFMNYNVILPNGTKVLTNGRVIQQDGKDFFLSENQMIDYNGTIKDNKKYIANVTPLVEPTYNANVISGIVSQYLEFNKDDFDKAKKDGKIIFVEFYSSWDAQAQQQEKYIEEAFNALSTNKVVGFRVHYKDDITSEIESMLAKENDVNKQDTKFILKNGQQIYRTELLIDDKTILEEINKAL